MSKKARRNSAALTARLSALMLVAGALAPTAYAGDTKPAQKPEQATEQTTEQAQATEQAKTQAKVNAAAEKPAAAPATAERQKPANPCAPAPRKKKARNPCA